MTGLFFIFFFRPHFHLMNRLFSAVSSVARAQTKLASGHTFAVVKNDITKEDVDVIVNAGTILFE